MYRLEVVSYLLHYHRCFKSRTSMLQYIRRHKSSFKSYSCLVKVGLFYEPIVVV